MEDNLNRVRERIANAAKRAGRNTGGITLVAVTKRHPVEEIRELAKLGVSTIAESRVQELTDKYESIKGAFEIHLVGHLQTNKVKPVVRMVSLIHSVDSLKLAQAIDSECEKQNKTMDILVQVNASFEPQKSGVSPEGLSSLLEEVSRLPRVRVKGLMTMAALEAGLDETRRTFRTLRQLRDAAAHSPVAGIEMTELSMGMSHDYEIAVEEGATLLRIGSALFEKEAHV